MLRILIADDHEIVLRGLKSLLLRNWMGSHRRGQDWARGSRAHRAVEAGHSDHRHWHAGTNVVEAGARAYVVKSDSARDLVRGVEGLIQRGAFFTCCAAQVLFDGYSINKSRPVFNPICGTN